MSTSDAALHQFRNAFSGITEVPYFSGIIPLDEKTSTLFYRSGKGKSGVVDFAKASEFDLKALAEACQPATFGLENKDVLDDSYRKAGKMDASEFALQFSPASAGIVNKIRDFLLQELENDRSIQVELYKLNVYGPGSFFKAHVDTPRSDNMFGSLVIVLPTIHEGGSLIFRHAGKEQTFDSAKAVSSQASPHAAFIAFYSDVEHEVSPVKSGYRVTITYNLYFAKHQESQPRDMLSNNIFSDTDEIAQMKSALEKLTADPNFLPEGGLLGFGLSHKYPFNPDTSSLEQISKWLKGSDFVVKRICEALGLQVSLKAIYTIDDRYNGIDYCLADKFVNLADTYLDQSLAEKINECGGMCVFNSTGDSLVRDDVDPIVWMKALKNLNHFSTPYIAYGNETSLACAYGEICLVAKIEEAGDRNAN